MISLPDVNVLLALAWSTHSHHAAAHRWFATEADAGWATCLFTQAGFVRLCLNPRITGASIGCEAAIDLLKDLVAHPTHQYMTTSPALTVEMFSELARRIIGYRQVADATLLLLARAHDMKLVTFDQGVTTVCPWQENLHTLAP